MRCLARSQTLLRPKQMRALRPYVCGRAVVDWGCGFSQMTIDLLDTLGASSVVAVDKDGWVQKAWENEGIEEPRLKFIHSYFEHLVDRELGADAVSLLSWPLNRPLRGLLECISVSDRVIYIGINDNMTVCGWAGLFEHFKRRPIELLAPSDVGNSDLIVYGPLGSSIRTDLCDHERRALEPGRFW